MEESMNSTVQIYTERLRQEMEALEAQVEKWHDFQRDYDALGKQLKTLPDQTSYSAMIPLGKLAFMPGKIIHTNEILVLLGDQYYAERSVKQSLEILERRRGVVDENLKLAEAQLNALKTKSETGASILPLGENNVNEEGLPIMEIREELPTETAPKPEKEVKKKKSVRFDVSSPKSQTETPPKGKQPAKQVDQELIDFLNRMELEEQEEQDKQNKSTEGSASEQLDHDGKTRNRAKYMDVDMDEDNGHYDEDEDEDEDEDDDDDDDDLYDTEVNEHMFDHFDDDEDYATQGIVEQEDATVHEHGHEDGPSVKSTIRSPADIFKMAAPESIVDDYPSLDDDQVSSEPVDILELAKSVRSKPETIWRPTKDSNIEPRPMVQPVTPVAEVKAPKKSKLDTGVMKGAVMERDIQPVDLEQVEQDMDLREITAGYHRKKQDLVAAMGGFQFEAKPEYEVIDEELPLPSKSKNAEQEPPPKPKKVSRFKAARLGLDTADVRYS